METTFNFSNHNHNTEFIYALHPKSEIILHIKRKNNSSATLYFTNQLNEKIDIPSDFKVYKHDKNNFNILLHPNETNDYTLYWRKNYDVVYNGETLYNIRNDRTWTIYN
jgi:hypothetical protein